MSTTINISSPKSHGLNYRGYFLLLFKEREAKRLRKYLLFIIIVSAALFAARSIRAEEINYSSCLAILIGVAAFTFLYLATTFISKKNLWENSYSIEKNYLQIGNSVEPIEIIGVCEQTPNFLTLKIENNQSMIKPDFFDVYIPSIQHQQELIEFVKKFHKST